MQENNSPPNTPHPEKNGARQIMLLHQLWDYMALPSNTGSQAEWPAKILQWVHEWGQPEGIIGIGGASRGCVQVQKEKVPTSSI